MHDGHPFHQVGEKYIRAVTDGIGGIPLEIPVLADHLDIEELLGLFDGILFSGSPSDIEPHHYAGTPSAPGRVGPPERDPRSCLAPPFRFRARAGRRGNA